MIQVALLAAVHPHPAPAVTERLAAPPAAVALGLVGDTLKLQAAGLRHGHRLARDGERARATRRRRVGGDRVVDRAVARAAAARVTVIQVALLVAVQAQPDPAVTVTTAAPPAEVALGLVGDRLYVQPVPNANVLESALAAEPPGPTAATSAT